MIKRGTIQYDFSYLILDKRICAKKYDVLDAIIEADDSVKIVENKSPQKSTVTETHSSLSNTVSSSGTKESSKLSTLDQTKESSISLKWSNTEDNFIKLKYSTPFRNALL